MILGQGDPLEKEMPVQVRCTLLDAWGGCTGTTQRDGMGREEGGEQKPKNFHRKARLVQTQWCLLARDLAMRNTGVKNRGALRLSHQSTEAA